MKVTAIVSQNWLALFLIIVFIAVGIATLEAIRSPENSKFCFSDSDCACGKSNATGECFYGNKNFVNASEQCPDFCAGIGGNFEIKCINSECRQVQKGNAVQSPECSNDSDCGTGGCSGQVCTTEGNAPSIITTCEYLPEYGCLKQTNCGCVSGKCEWKKTQEYLNCMKSFGKLSKASPTTEGFGK